MKIAVDFDGTLEFEFVQEIIKKYIANGHQVEIVTTRYDDEHKHLYANWEQWESWNKEGLNEPIFKLARELNIPCHFCNMVYKAEYLNANGFDMLIDDNPEEQKNLSKKIKFILRDKLDEYEEKVN